MAKRFPAVTYREVVKVLQNMGFEFYRQAKGSHETDGRHTTLSKYAGKAIKRRTLKSVLYDAGLSIEEFQELL
ncbi:type II toxin-antitoxin system HicA family toxin [bacterium]|nr:type II toxin-antitoxin system HicA family toxin [bacterium]MBU1599096.1 type II toxin-antitoxin system HicA family toxin [bacterium]